MLKEKLETVSGSLFEISGYEDRNIKSYLARCLKEYAGVVLYIDTAHTLTEPILPDMLYTQDYRYPDILEILDNEPEPDLIILDNLYNIADKPAVPFTLFNISRIVSQHTYNLLFVNQFVYNFKEDKKNRKYVPQYDRLYRKYCSFRQIVYSPVSVRTTLDKIKISKEELPLYFG